MFAEIARRENLIFGCFYALGLSGLILTAWLQNATDAAENDPHEPETAAVLHAKNPEPAKNAAVLDEKNAGPAKKATVRRAQNRHALLPTADEADKKAHPARFWTVDAEKEDAKP